MCDIYTHVSTITVLLGSLAWDKEQKQLYSWSIVSAPSGQGVAPSGHGNSENKLEDALMY